MDNNFDEIKLIENNTKGKIILNGYDIKSLTGYTIKRGTDIVDVTLNISVPISNFETMSY